MPHGSNRAPVWLFSYARAGYNPPTADKKSGHIGSFACDRYFFDFDFAVNQMFDAFGRG